VLGLYRCTVQCLNLKYIVECNSYFQSKSIAVSDTTSLKSILSLHICIHTYEALCVYIHTHALKGVLPLEIDDGEHIAEVARGECNAALSAIHVNKCNMHRNGFVYVHIFSARISVCCACVQ
jgi:hypothetical protein